MNVEIVLPRKYVYLVWILLGLVGLTVLGAIVSPAGEDGQPLLFSPRLAEIKAYQRQAAGWVGALEDVQVVFDEILSSPEGDLFSQDRELSRAYGQLVRMLAEIDGTEAPASLTGLQSLLFDTVSAYLEAAARISSWISEPTQENAETAALALAEAANLLERATQNSWLQP